MEEKDKQKFEEIIAELEQYRARHTELISLYIPAGFNINTVNKQIEAEKSTASNIKGKNTRKAVLDALERIGRALKLYKNTPEKGIVLFSGNISKTEGQEDIRIWEVIPPVELKTRLYRCDQIFILDPLKEMLEVSEVYGLVVMDRKEATIGLLEGKNINVLRKLTSGVPSKIRAGGQSSQRFHRVTEGLAKEFYRRISEAMKEEFFELKKLKGILIGGPVPTKDDFMAEGQLVTALKEKVIAMKDLGYADEHGLKLLVEASDEELAQQEIIKEKKLMENFFNLVGKSPEKVAYGEDKVMKALNYGAVEVLLVSKKIKGDNVEKIKKKAEETSSTIEIISTETPEGEQFYNMTKGFGAVLRFPI
jgi:peptide chain release factor subunit 1